MVIMSFGAVEAAAGPPTEGGPAAAQWGAREAIADGK